VAVVLPELTLVQEELLQHLLAVEAGASFRPMERPLEVAAFEPAEGGPVQEAV
tara:strand:+ start:336 stop:494 length:159 start_codon:yes stop_codon:yes gene_type:complete